MSSRAVLLILLAVLLLVAGIRYRLLDVPLERDEGEYAYAGQLILEGSLPYENLYNMKLPGIYAAYAIMLSIFGQTHTGIHAGLLFINAATSFLIFLLGRRLFGPLAGLVAAAIFAVMSVSQAVQGIIANAEHFVILPVVGGLLLLLKACDKGRTGLLFASGLLLGLGFLMKQHGIAFILAGGLVFVSHHLRRRPLTWKPLFFQIFVLVGGVMIPYVVTCLIFVASGSSGQFWFWTVEYARAHTAENDRIAVIASEPQIYFYARRRAATGYVYTYPLMEYHDHALKMQEQMSAEIMENEPEYIVYIDPGSMPWSWAPGEKSHRYLIEWFNRYKNRHYTRVGLVDVYRQKANYRWGVEALGAPQSRHWIEVLQRKKDRNLLGV